MSAERDKELDALWVAHTAPSENNWDNWRRYGHAVAQAERYAVLKVCALEGITVADIIRITQERSRA